MTGQLGKFKVDQTILKQLVYGLMGRRLLIINYWVSILFLIFNPKLQTVFNMLEDRLRVENRPKLAEMIVQDKEHEINYNIFAYAHIKVTISKRVVRNL